MSTLNRLKLFGMAADGIVLPSPSNEELVPLSRGLFEE
jgi:hypothetical protein